MSAARLRLGPLPKAKVVKLTVTMTAELKSALEHYAELHSQLHGEKVDAAVLIPHMLAAFIARDRVFTKKQGERRAS
jgi:hypothetical protein